ncbi:MAG: D-alanyl-D-alanine carboxypeptidase/D-alanyl-D-alanine-endopeptidase, partial [Planctomycetota bacterium]|nr:D-alanyl-D-alanine carboxypeptidase/D-alanyl-D-alanine-endopeptidase [Planctomycetota bacterium]
IRTEPGSRAAVGGRWVGDGPVLDLHGRVPVGGRASFNVPVPDPALFLGGAVLSALAAQNVLVDDGVRHARDADDARAGTLLGEHAAPLEPALQVMNQRSQNAYASTLFKTAGRALTGEGSWASGGRAVNAMLERRRIYDEGSTDMRDGSGLSTSNRVSAAVLAQVLHSFDTDPLRGPLLFRSLPISGESGTLDDRLRGLKGRVHAKTGTLNDVQARALAGYIERPGKPGYAFAILLNGRGASHGLIDDLVVEIAR